VSRFPFLVGTALSPGGTKVAIKQCDWNLQLSWRDCMVKILDLATNQLTFLAGSPVCGMQDGTGTSAGFGYGDDIHGVAFMPDGNSILVADGAKPKEPS
jgi:hypothetical protein